MDETNHPMAGRPSRLPTEGSGWKWVKGVGAEGRRALGGGEVEERGGGGGYS